MNTFLIVTAAILIAVAIGAVVLIPIYYMMLRYK